MSFIRGLYIGRFNPFHLGHQKAIEYIMEKNLINHLIIGIGSSQESYSVINPFTGGERFEMIQLALEDMNLKDFYISIVPLADLNNNNQWIPYIKSFLPKFKIIFSNNTLVKALTNLDNTLSIQQIPLVDRKLFSSTNIRSQMISDNNSWKKSVPAVVADFIEEINGIDRLKLLASNDLS